MLGFIFSCAFASIIGTSDYSKYIGKKVIIVYMTLLSDVTFECYIIKAYDSPEKDLEGNPIIMQKLIVRDVATNKVDSIWSDAIKKIIEL
jgi:hypothetical protein